MVHGKFIEGSCSSHQVPLPHVKTDPEELHALETWLASYSPEQLFTESGDAVGKVKSIIPRNEKKMGQRPETFNTYLAPKMPDWREFVVQKGTSHSTMKLVAKLLDKVLMENPRTVRIFSPDELESNKLEGVLAHTGRNFQWDQFSRAHGGRIVEVSSEHMCQAFMQGYTLTGRVALFPSYECFLGIIDTMMVQYAKFVKLVSLTHTDGLVFCVLTCNIPGTRNKLALQLIKSKLH